MIEQIYVEEAVRQHPRTTAITRRFSSATVVPIQHYGEIFNRHAQNFRLQKSKPALILGEKIGRKMLAAPPGLEIGGTDNFYFSHMLNCLYDCRYCFLQGMFQSAHYLLFVNYEDFLTEIIDVAQKTPGAYFFSGYDCDSLALEPISEFVEFILPAFESIDGCLELRTKSTQIRTLLARPALPNVVVAFSVSPEEVVASLEARTPSLSRRLEAMASLAAQGWSIGVRLDPIIAFDGAARAYEQCIRKVFEHLAVSSVHSVTIGEFRLPKPFYKKMSRLYPTEPLFNHAMHDSNTDQASLPGGMELIARCHELLCEHVPADRIFGPVPS